MNVAEGILFALFETEEVGEMLSGFFTHYLRDNVLV